jgi:diguanylate cyclase (GGDEF)-like protein
MSELQRLRSLHSYQILDTVSDERFERITRIAGYILDTPMAAISLIDRDRQWFKSSLGLAIRETPRDVSFCSHTIEQDDTFIVEDATHDPRFSSNLLVTHAPHIRFYAGVPLNMSDGQKIGTLCCLHTRARKISADKIARLQDLARIVVDELEFKRAETADSVTGAMSRNSFCEELSREINRSKRYGNKLSCGIIDIDHLEHVNETQSIAAGDRLLRTLVQVCNRSMRRTDFIGRVGGDGFGLVMLETTISSAFEITERLREKLDAALAPATVSIGICELNDSHVDLDELLQGADAALAYAKLRGGNSTAFYGADLSLRTVPRRADPALRAQQSA